MINLTQHPASPEQVAAGVVDLPAASLARLTALLTFGAIPSGAEIDNRAACIASMVPVGTACAMIGGAMWLMAPLERALLARNIGPMYAFSARESVETVQSDGSVRKTAIFRHLGFVRASSAAQPVPEYCTCKTGPEYFSEAGTGEYCHHCGGKP